MAPTSITNNYRRRLSLAAPATQNEVARKRGISCGNVLRGLDSPERRRLRFKKAFSEISDETPDRRSLMSLQKETIAEEEEKANGVNFALDIAPSDDTKETVDTEKVRSDAPRENLILRGQKRQGTLQRSRTVDEPGLYGPAGQGEEYNPRRSLRGESEKGKKKPQRSVQFADKPEKAVKFVSPKHSPSVSRRNFARAHTKSLDEGFDEARSSNKEDTGLAHHSSLRKNPSYSKAMLQSFVEDSDEQK